MSAELRGPQQGQGTSSIRGRANLRAQANWMTRPWPERPGPWPERPGARSEHERVVERSEQERETSVAHRGCAFFADERAAVETRQRERRDQFGCGLLGDAFGHLFP